MPAGDLSSNPLRFLGMSVHFVSPVVFPVISLDSDVTGVTNMESRHDWEQF